MTNRTALFSRHQPGGVFTIEDVVQHPGAIFFVHSGTGTDADGNGKNPDAPFATLDYAVGKCTASKGDVIYILPGHAENLTAADSVDCDVAGVTIIGLGHGNLVPTFSATAAAGAIKVDAANVTIKNLKLLAAFATGVTKALDITAAGDGCTLDGLKFRDTSATSEYLMHIAVATTVTDLQIQNCSFVTLAGSLTNSILFAGTSTDAVIRRNVFFVDSADSVIDHLAGAPVNILIDSNYIVNQDTGAAGYVIDVHASGTGMACNNRGAYANVAAEMTKGAAMWWLENYFSNTIAESGLLEPATSHAIP
jgi:hypothetical protein